ncbi:NAD(P)-binding domain-containing protein [Pseudomonas sp. S1Bt23]|uniref:NAD(P)-binding domain-containing protein n=1 Tax=Pseudomonas sp. S1Bt23 TaxID=3095074 RepID=UPI002A5A0524|nr:NAD(P)-binding domain-containing protein [Pseudomonas sp. S1Bt23]WPO46648.1 NAD(P)-binding domain-containing protein [Pseudomonas sp. S1Bt23]
MYSVLFIGKGTITTSLSKSLDTKEWRVDHHTRAGKKISETNLAGYDYVVSCLPDTETAEMLWNETLVSALRNRAYKTVFIDISTLTPTTIKKINDAFHQEKLTFIEAPFTGSKTGALNGSLIYFTSSDTVPPESDTFLKSTSSKIYKFDSIGTPTQFKLLYNLWGLTSLGLLGQMSQIINGLPQADLMSEILTSNEDFWMGTIARQKLDQSLSQNYEDIHCKLKHAKKDIRYALNEFSDHKLDLSRCLLSILDEDRLQHYDDSDFTSMREFFQ